MTSDYACTGLEYFYLVNQKRNLFFININMLKTRLQIFTKSIQFNSQPKKLQYTFDKNRSLIISLRINIKKNHNDIQ